jgi:hypothetical protein
MRTHQPDQGVFRSVLAENVDWEPFAAFPPSARLASWWVIRPAVRVTSTGQNLVST